MRIILGIYCLIVAAFFTSCFVAAVPQPSRVRVASRRYLNGADRDWLAEMAARDSAAGKDTTATPVL